MLSTKMSAYCSPVIILFMIVLLVFASSPIQAHENTQKKSGNGKAKFVHVVFPYGKLKAPKQVTEDDHGQQGRTVNPSGLTTIMSDGFETDHSPGLGAPDFGPDLWNVYSINGFDARTWDDQGTAEFRSGSWSMWCASGGSPVLIPGTSLYPNDMRTWAVYGPFDLSDANDGYLRFYYKGNTLSNDYLRILASTDGSNFYGKEWDEANNSSWTFSELDFTNVGGRNFTGNNQVWIAFVFTSSDFGTDEGIWIDDIAIRKYVPDSQPWNDSLDKSSTSGAYATFFPTYYDTDGYNDLEYCYFRISTSDGQTNAVYTKYDVVNNLLYLRNDAGAGWGTGVTPGSYSILSNSQGRININNVKVSMSGLRVVLEIPVRFSGEWTGVKNLSMYCIDKDSQSDGWDNFGTFTVENATPELTAVLPSVGNGNTWIFNPVYKDENGYRDLRYLYFKIADTSGQQGGCVYFRYRKITNKIDLRSDVGGSWYGGYVIGSANTLQNSQVSVDVSGITYLNEVGGYFSFTLPLVFKPAFQGQHNIYMNALDLSNASSGWTDMGDWRVPGNPTAPANVSVSPNSGGGGWKTFDVTFADANGADDLRYLYFKVNTTQGNANCAYVRYDHVAGTIDLRNNAGSGWIAGGAIGSPGTVSNGQVSVNYQFVTITEAGDNLTLRVPMVFDSSFNGAKNLYLYCVDTTNLNSGWQDKGNFTVTAAAPPAGEKSHSVSLSGVEILSGSRIFLNDYVDTDGEATWWVDGRRLRKINPSYRFTEDGLYSLALRVTDSEDNRILSGNDLFVGERLLRAGDLAGWTGSKRSLHDRSVMKITDIRKKDRIIRLRGRLIPGIRLMSGQQGSHDYYFVECREGDTPERWSWVLGRELAGEELILASRTIRPSDSVRMLEVVIDPKEGTFTAMLDGKRLFPKRLVLEYLRGSVILSVPKQTTDLDIIVSRKAK